MEALRAKAGSVIKHPEDKGITRNGPIPGKHEIEAEAKKKRDNVLDRFIHDTIELRAKDMLEVKYEKLLDLAIKARPKQVEGDVNVNYTFRDMASNAAAFQKERRRKLEEARNAVDTSFVSE